MLFDAKARQISPGSGALAAGGVAGLFLHPSASRGSGKWILRFVSPVTGKRRDLGLGAYPAVGIAAFRYARDPSALRNPEIRSTSSPAAIAPTF
jgi:hypothetical protein